MSDVTDETLRCSFCPKIFDTKAYLAKHVKRMHGDEEKPRQKYIRKGLECSMCGKVFPRLSHLQRHQLTHLNVREFTCPFCSDSFVQKSNLVRHIGRLHPYESQNELDQKIGSRRWTDDTPSTSNTAGSLGPATHDGKPFTHMVVCHRCGDTFGDRSQLDQHTENTHKRFVCGNCNKTFHGRTELADHQRKVHENLFSCTCGATFASLNSFRNHHKSCYGKGTFLCKECGRVFLQRIQLDRHWRREHFSRNTCPDCDWVAVNPLLMAEHMKELHQKVCCGYCGETSPAKSHISDMHWQRLRRAVPIDRRVELKPRAVISQRKSSSESGGLDAHSSEDILVETDIVHQGTQQSTSVSPDGSADLIPDNPLAPESNNIDSLSIDEGDFGTEDDTVTANCASPVTNGIICDSLDDLLPNSMELPPADDISTGRTKEFVVNLVVSVPDELNRVFISDRLPIEMIDAFPELRDLTVTILDACSGVNRFLSLHIPLTCPVDTDVTKWTSAPFYV